MEGVLAIAVGGLYAAAVYLLLRRSVVKLVIGLVLLSHASNLLIFTVGRLVRGAPPVIDLGSALLVAPYADPVPQALVLTAIVIGFGVQAFAIVLLKRTYRAARTDDLDAIDTTERWEP